MSCTVKVLNESAGARVVIPNKAVVEQMGEYFVYAVMGNQVKQTKIETGGRVNDKIIVANGLKPGEKIVVEGIQKLHDGSQIQTRAPHPGRIQAAL
jgi:membrane fusion protein, multidrug efflux system